MALASEVTGRFLGLAEQALGQVWSLGEVAVMASHWNDIRHDPHREAMLSAIASHGFYPPIDTNDCAWQGTESRIEGRNPYQRLQANPHNDRILAHMSRAASGNRRHLVVVCHCYGLPIPRLMHHLFGLGQLRDCDVVYNIMNHHYHNSYPAWPGTGFVSGRMSRFIDNIRSAITGLRALILELRHRHEYESVTVLGFSIGGQLALHAANSAPVDQAILYCPVTNLRQTSAELGWMKYLQPWVTRMAQGINDQFSLDDLELTNPLAYPLAIAPERLHVIVQRYDALATPQQIGAIRTKYPACHWHEYNGTHIVPMGMRDFQRYVAETVHTSLT